MRRPLGPALLVGIAAFVVYLPSLSNGFTWDDERDIRDNPAIVDATGPVEVVSAPYRGAVPSARSPYRPVTSLTYWLNWAASGPSPLPYHLVNVLLHALASALVASLLLGIGAPVGPAIAGGLLFAVHPVHVEAVANIVGRADVLMTVFCLTAALAFKSTRWGPGTRAVVVALAYGLALGSKENGVVLPGLLALLLTLPGAEDSEPGSLRSPTDRAGPAAERLRKELIVLAPTLLVLGAYLALRYRVLGTLVHRDTAPYIAVLTSGERTTTAVANVTHIIRLLVWPADLAADYGPDVIVVAGVGAPRFWAGLVSLALVAALAWTLYRRNRVGAAAVGWIVLSSIIVSNLVLPIGIWVAERTLYLPSVGVSMAAVALMGSVARRAPSRLPVLWVLTTFLMAAGAWKSLERIPSWESNDAALATLAEEHPESYRSQWWLARRFTELSDYETGLRWYDQARRTNPNDLGLALDHARALLLAGRPRAAESLATTLPPTDPARFVYLAQSRIMTDRLEEAREDVRAGLERFPRDPRLRGQAVELGIPLDE